MNRAAQEVMKEFRDILMAYGESDEYSFLFRRDTTLYDRRASKLTTYIASLFSSAFVFHWKECFPDVELKYPPFFDARAVCYPRASIVRDYFSWRQADCHINNLYNTAFWSLVQQGGLTPSAAEQRLRGTDSGAKNEILFQNFGINYAKLPAMYRKGTVLVWDVVTPEEMDSASSSPCLETCKQKGIPVPLHVDIIGDEFWRNHPKLLPPD